MDKYEEELEILRVMELRLKIVSQIVKSNKDVIDFYDKESNDSYVPFEWVANNLLGLDTSNVNIFNIIFDIERLRRHILKRHCGN